jgi:hypothetical protein
LLHRPLTIVGMTIFLGIMFPIFAITWLVFHETPYWENLDPFAIVMGLLSTVIGYGIWKVRPWAAYSYMTLSCFILGTLLFQFLIAPNLEEGLVLFGIATFIIGSCVAVQGHIRAPYFNPNFQWGRRDVRYRMNVDVTFEVNKKACRGGLIDISRNGCFVDLDIPVEVGQKIEFVMHIFEFHLNMQAQIVRSGQNPKGFGIMFFGTTREVRKDIDSLIAKIMHAPPSEKVKRAI